MKPLKIKKGTRFVTMPHIAIYRHIWETMYGISESQKALSVFQSSHGNLPDQESEINTQYHALHQKKAFYASCARIYPVRFLEAQINFIGSQYDIPFRTDFEKTLSIVKKYKLYLHLVAGATIEQKYLNFMKAVIELRDNEVHPIASGSIVGSEQNQKNSFLYGSALHQCTLLAMIVSINKVVRRVEEHLGSTKNRPPTMNLVDCEYLECHRKLNEQFIILD